MIKVIEGKRYNTDTAEVVLEWTNGKFGNFEYREKVLNRTKQGNWFVYHYGGPMTDMAVSAEFNSWSGSEDIEAISEKEVLKFLEEYNGYEALEKFFTNEISEA